MKPGMLSQPSVGLGTVVAGEVVGDDVDVAHRIVSFDVMKQSDVVRRGARGGASGQFLAIAHTQRSIDPGFLGTATVIQRCFDAMSSGRPGRRWGKGVGNYWPEFVGANGRRPLWWLGVVADDRWPDCGQNPGTVAPTMGVTPPHAFAQIDAPDLAAFDPYPGFFGSLGQRIKRPPGGSLPVSGYHRPIGLRREVPWRRLLDQGENPAVLPLRQPGLPS